MKTKILLGSALMIVTGVSFFATEWASADSGGYIPRDSEAKIRPSIEERINGGREIFDRLRATPNGEIDEKIIADVKKRADRRRSKRSSLGLEWGFMGPNNRGGRTRALVIDNQNSNRLYTGGVAGGLFISDNSGGSWQVYDDQMENLHVTTIDQGPNGDLYVGTGGDFGGSSDDIPGAGIYKSTDGGVTFTQLPSTDPETSGFQWRKVNRIEVSPDNDDVVLAGTGGGLYLSTDGGTTWNEAIYLDQANCSFHGTGEIEDIEWTDGNIAVIGYNGGVYRSTNPTDPCSYVSVSDGIPSSSGRIDITYCKVDEDKMYAIQVTGGGQLAGVYESNNGGETWFDMSPAPPTEQIDSTFNLFGDNGQGIYDLAIEVVPDECDMVYIGGVQTYRVAGSWTRIAENFAFEYSGFYVHSDKHYFAFDPKNSNIMYVTSDGGISRTENAKADQPLFFTVNRDLATTQFYGISTSRDGTVIGGTQDNGSWLIDPSLPGVSAKDGTSIRGGDGFDTEISDIFTFGFATSQFGTVSRYSPLGQETVFEIPSPGPFWSIIRLWESDNDATSQDSVTFNNDEATVSVQKGNGSRRQFTGTVIPAQPAAEFVNQSIRFRNAFASTDQIIYDVDGSGTMVVDDTSKVNGIDTVGSFNYSTGDYDITFPIPPADQSDIVSRYETVFSAGDTLILRSNTQRREYEYVLMTGLNVGDSVIVQDPVQSLFVGAFNTGPAITREGLRDNVSASDWITLPGIGIATCFEFSEDGNTLYVGTNSNVHRVTGLNNLYEFGDLSQISSSVIYNSSFGSITGLCLHPSDEEKILVTMGGYNHSEHIVELNNIMSGPVSEVMKEGDLPGFPVYDAEYDVLNPSIVLIGTDFGVWSTSDINATSIEWFNESATLSNTPVFDVIQQRLGWDQADNHEVYYAGTHGRGIWSTNSLINSVDDDFDSFEKEVDLGLSMYPNPVSDQGSVNFNLAEQSSVDIQVFDLNGRAVRQFMNRSFEAGQNTFTMNTSDLSAGTYVLTVKSDAQYSTSKFVVVK